MAYQTTPSHRTYPAVGAVVVEPPRIDDFTLVLRFNGDQVIVGVEGDVDVLTAPTLAALLNLVADQGHTDVVVDLAQSDFMDAAGLGVLAASSHRLSGSLIVRSPPPQTQLILDLTGISEIIKIETSDTAGSAGV